MALYHIIFPEAAWDTIKRQFPQKRNDMRLKDNDIGIRLRDNALEI